ncbi:Mog1p/PsbP-like protein [Auriscalpium vulgare]|uniref:Mog1p/PsbP-like protein n=1 Tax=Auriscalpium vulgare TaxID=40419 RepID=A0ACB8RZQ6_9AGAM|nr:Mog1p/PsbP-like protein [Auriscalpium vulgare]
MSNYAQRDLFGGAIVALLPSKLIDASDIRQVPDTQEVLLFPDSDISIILEILQRVDHPDHADAARFHFESLAHDNDALSSTVHQVNIVPNDRGDNTPSPVVLYGTQIVPKFNRATGDDVRILLALYRVEDKGIDLVLTMNVPMQNASGTSTEQAFNAAKENFDTAARSLRIEYFGLFA